MYRVRVSVYTLLVIWCLSSQSIAAPTGFVPDAWPQDTRAPVNSSPVLGDLDGDGVLEIVIGSDNHKVYAWKPDGSLLPGWPVSTNDSVRSSPALSDLDGDGRLDVIVGSFDNNVYAWNFNGSPLPGWPVTTGSLVYSSPAIGDIDGDQRPEVVVGSFDNKVYAWNADGTILRGWPKPTGLFVYSSPALADLDRDGTPEVIVGSDNNRVFAWNGDGSAVQGWPTATEHEVPSSPAVGDIDGDGELDVVVGSWDKVFAWNNRGEQKSGWPVTAGHQVPSSPAIVDLNNDGRLEILIGCKDGKVYAWDAFGRKVEGWPVVTDGQIESSPVVGDVNGDGVLEIAIGSSDNKVYVWDAQGQLLPGWPKVTNGTIAAAPALGDLDNDGTIELVAGSKDNRVYAWSFPPAGAFPQRLVWRNFHGNLAHTGTYGVQLTPYPGQTPVAGKSRTGQRREAEQPLQPVEFPQPRQQDGSPTPVIPLEIREGEISDLAIADYTEDSVTLTWTSPSRSGGADTRYDIRYSPRPITAETWATSIQYPAAMRPAPPGAREVIQLKNLHIPQQKLVNMLYFAVRLTGGGRGFPVSRSVRLDLPDTRPPNAIEEIEVRELTATSVELSWIAPGDDGTSGAAAEYDIRYADTPLLNEPAWERAAHIQNEPAPLPSGRTQRLQVEKPWDDREIFWGIRAIDEAGNISDFSEPAVWAPQDAIPPSRIVDLRVSSISGTDVTITWTAPGNNRRIGTARRYDVRYADFPISEESWEMATPVENPPSPKTAGTRQSHVLQGIPIGKLLYVGIKTTDASGNVSPLSNVVETAMDDMTPPAAVTDLKIEQTGKDWVQLSWTATGDDGKTGLAAAYVMRYGGSLYIVKSWDEAMDACELPAPSMTGQRDRATISGLAENTTYFVGLRVLDRQGNSSDTSNIVRVKTLSHSTPEAVTDLVIEEVRAEGVTLNWTAPRDVGEQTNTVRGYDVRYSPTAMTESTWDDAVKYREIPKPSSPDTLESFTFKGGVQDSAFFVALKSYDALGNYSALSNVIRVPRIDTDPPAPVFDLAVEETGQDWIRIRWSASGDDGQSGRANSVLIRVAPTLRQIKSWDKATAIPNSLQPSPADTKETYTITGLNSDSTFFVAVKSVDAFGNVSEVSNIVRAKTRDAMPPAPIQDLHYTGLEDGAVQLRWTATGEDGREGQAASYDVRYAQEPITPDMWSMLPQVSVVPGPSKSGQTETLRVSGLQPNSTYYFAVITVDGSGNRSSLSNVVEATTPDTVSPPAITTLEVEQVQETSVLLRWLSPGDDERHPAPRSYDLRYARELLNEGSWGDASRFEETPSPSKKGVQEEMRLTGLEENTAYYIGVTSLDNGGNISPLSNIVHIYTAPEVVDDLEILDFSGQSVTLTWSAPGGDLDEVRRYDIRYSTSNITDAAWEQATPAPNLPERVLRVKEPPHHEKVELTGLPTYEQLFFAVKVLSPNVPGEASKISNVVELNRLDLIPPGTITTLEVKDLGRAGETKQALELSWQAPGDNKFDGTAATYDLRYGDMRPDEENWETLTAVDDVPAPLPAGVQQHVTIHIPHGENTIYFGLRAYDEALNVSGISNIVQWVPEDDIPPARITDLSAERLKNGDITVRWTAPGDNEDRGVAAFYDIRFSSSDSTLQAWNAAEVVPGEPLPEQAGTTQEYTISGLLPGETYYLAMKTTDDAANSSALSNIARVVAVPPDRIEDLAFVGGTATTVTVSWTAPADRDAQNRIVRYDIRYAQKKEHIEGWHRAKKVTQSMVPKAAGETESLIIEGLEPNSRYYIGIQALEQDGENSGTSNIVTVYTADTIAPQPVQDMAVAERTRDSITLSWTVVRDDEAHDLPEYYDLRYSLDPIREDTWNLARPVEGFGSAELRPDRIGETMTYTIEGLEENTRYHVGIRALDAHDNLSPLSDPLTAWTKDVTPPLPVTDLQAVFPTSYSILLRWTCPSDALSERARALVEEETMISGVPDERTLLEDYDIRYDEVSLERGHLARMTMEDWENAQQVRMPPKPLTPGTVQTFVVNNLKPGKTYRFAMKTIDHSGNESEWSNLAVNTTMPHQFAASGQAAIGQTSPILPKEAYGWELAQGEDIVELHLNASGVLRIRETSEGQKTSVGDVLTAVYPGGNQEVSLPQGELGFQIKGAPALTLCVSVRADLTDEPYSLCYTTEGQWQADRMSALQKGDGSRIGKTLFIPLAPLPQDNQWHEIRLNLAQDLLKGTGQTYRESRRFFLRGSSSLTLRDMVLKGAVVTTVTDFEDRVNPLQADWKIHFGQGRTRIEHHPEQDNSFLSARSDSDQPLVLTYPRDGSGRLSDLPIFLTHLRAGSEFKLILKVRTTDEREYYLAYLPQAALDASGQSVGLSGNYIYLPLPVTSDQEFSSGGNWTLVRATIEEDLAAFQLDYAQTTWLSFHGKAFSLDNIRFSTDILETPLQ